MDMAQFFSVPFLKLIRGFTPFLIMQFRSLNCYPSRMSPSIF